MGLYLCIFSGDEEIDGVEVGSYADYGSFLDYVSGELEGGRPGSRFPTLVLHSDCDGEWSFTDCQRLRIELAEIAEALKHQAVVPFHSEWQKAAAKSVGLKPQTAFESFIDVDGESLVERLQRLVESALRHALPIVFQ